MANQIQLIYSILIFVLGMYFINTNNTSLSWYHPPYSYILRNQKSVYLPRTYRLLVILLVSAMFTSGSAIYIWIVYAILIIFSLIMYGRNNDYTSLLKYCPLYVLFLVWCLITLTFSNDIYRGVMMMMKLIIPILFFYLVQHACREKKRIWVLIHHITKGFYFYAFLVLIGSVITLHADKYYGMSLTVIPLAMAWKKKNIRYLLLVFLIALQSIIVVKRTPLLGIGISICFFYIFKYKLKAVVPLLLALSLAIGAILSIPSFREKIFGGEKNNADITLEQVANEDDVTELINTNGREVMWEYALYKFYIDNKVTGCGLGTLKGFMTSSDNEFQSHFLLLHNDWLHLLCETGIIGIFLLGGFFINIFILSFKYSKKDNSIETRILSCCCAGTAASTITHMYFENSLNTMTYTMAFVFYSLLVCQIKSKETKQSRDLS